MSRRVRFTDAAVCLLGLDDPVMRDEMGLPGPVGGCFDLTAEQGAKLRREFHDRCAAGWDHSNRGAVVQTANAAIRELDRAFNNRAAEPRREPMSTPTVGRAPDRLPEIRGDVARLWTFTQHARKEMDSSLAEDIAIMIDARERGLRVERAEILECLRDCLTELQTVILLGRDDGWDERHALWLESLRLQAGRARALLQRLDPEGK